MKPSRSFEYNKDKKDKSVACYNSMQRRYISPKQDIDGLRASFNISMLIAKSGKPVIIGEELILPAVEEVLRTVLNRQPADVIDKILLTNQAVQMQIDLMAKNVEESLFDRLKTCQFSILVDEIATPSNEVLILAYVRFIKDTKICQELLFARSLAPKTKFPFNAKCPLFSTLEKFCEENKIPLSNIVSATVDGTSAVTGRYKNFMSYLKNSVPSAIAVHTMIHRQHLVARHLCERLNISLQYVVRAVNHIRTNSLTGKLFTELCFTHEEDSNYLLIHTQLRWLSKVGFLIRFYKCFDSVIEFLENKDNDLRDKLIASKKDVAYLTDLFTLFNMFHLQHQSYNSNLIKAKNIVGAFEAKLLLFKRNLAKHEFYNFPNLSELQYTNEDLHIYCQHLTNLHSNFLDRFHDILNMTIPDWVLDPFSNVSTAGSPQFEEELIELTTNEELKVKFKNGYEEFWLQQPIPQLYPGLWTIVQRFIIGFPSSYVFERGFNAVTKLLVEKNNQLEIIRSGGLRMYLTELEPDINQLIKIHQMHNH